ncbi:hypothetical protein GCM10009734_24370 [Nonomuraea bangladeshensis]
MLVMVRDTVIRGRDEDVVHRVAGPVRLAARSSRTNEAFQSVRIGLV